jgi:hypothetical protein
LEKTIMNRSFFITGLLATALALFLSPPAYAQYGGRGHGQGGYGGPGGVPHHADQGMRYRLETVESDTGVISEVAFMVSGQHKVTTITLKTDKGSLLVALGPKEFIDSQPVKFAVGDNVLVQGSKAKVYDQTVLIAAEVTDKGDILKLRDPETGKPLWFKREGDPEAPAPPGSPEPKP